MIDLDRWMNERTFHHSQFSDIRELVARKRAQGLTISLCFPALNEERTIGREIRILRRELMERYPLLDEIGVVDSGSTDRTREVSERAGASFHLAADCLPSLGSRRGKGENLWKSLYLFSGDIIVWIDSDIRNIHPKFVYGLLGPLLHDPAIGYVKAFYRRPIRIGRRTFPGGGRVTELLVRPFLNMFYPDLSLFAQPLSGEYAGRRQLLEQMPFFSGYGVEIGLLIDLEQRFGIGAIAQVDVDERIHRNQNLESLRRMSYVILSVMIERSEQLGKLALLESLGHRLHLLQREGAHYLHATEEVRGTERPPMITVSEYQRKRGIADDDRTLIEGFIGQKRQVMPPIIAHIDDAIVVMDMSSKTAAESFRELVERIPSDRCPVGAQELVTGLIDREHRMNTGLGQGVAIPHFVSPRLRALQLIIGRSAAGIDFGAVDQEPVRLVVMLLAPENQRDRYLNVLAAIARLLQEPGALARLAEAETPDSLLTVLKKYEALIRLRQELEPTAG
ncbi:MAG TPA: glucosyl-3-phosphoglycerate synthase [Spirochaetia bacterium]|nr:glucosyl-3-phosphoglycerate synthase [Spirochaetia bacterium]